MRRANNCDIDCTVFLRKQAKIFQKVLICSHTHAQACINMSILYRSISNSCENIELSESSKWVNGLQGSSKRLVENITHASSSAPNERQTLTVSPSSTKLTIFCWHIHTGLDSSLTVQPESVNTSHLINR